MLKCLIVGRTSGAFPCTERQCTEDEHADEDENDSQTSDGPTIEAVEGDRVRIYVTNKLPEGTRIHWHGVLVPSGMDGVAGLSQKNIAPGETYKYAFQLIVSDF